VQESIDKLEAKNEELVGEVRKAKAEARSSPKTCIAPKSAPTRLKRARRTAEAS
jgi:hypothetical protein